MPSAGDRGNARCAGPHGGRAGRPRWIGGGWADIRAVRDHAIGGKEIRWPRPRVGADKGVHTGERLSGRAYFFHQRPSSLSGALSTPSVSPILTVSI